MKTCPRCGLETQTTEPRCPACGAQVRVAYVSPVANLNSGGMRALMVLGMVIITVAPVVYFNGPRLFAGWGLGGQGQWSESSMTCEVDANGDHALDIVGLSGPSSSTNTLTLVDGKNGEVLWKGNKYGDSAQAFCPNRQWIGVSKADFTVEFLSVKDRTRTFVVKLSDTMRSYCLGTNCVDIEASDGQRKGYIFGEAGVEPGNCVCSPEPSESAADPLSHSRGSQVVLWRDRPGIIDVLERELTVVDGSTTVALIPKRAGTPMLSVELRENDKARWRKELPYKKGSGGSGIALGPTHVMVWGSELEREVGVLIGLDRKTGEISYANLETSDWSMNVESLFYNGRFLVAVWGSGLHAYEPTTGVPVWSVGAPRVR